MLEIFSKNAGLNFDDYVLHRGKKLRMDLPDEKTEYLILVSFLVLSSFCLDRAFADRVR